MGLEARLRDYLAHDPGRIHPGYRLLAIEHPLPGGRIDLLCTGPDGMVGVELKALPYAVQGVTSQLTRYLDTLPCVAFIAPKVRRAVYASLAPHHDAGRLALYELTQACACVPVTPAMLDDARPFPRIAVPALPRASPFTTASRAFLKEYVRHAIPAYVQHPLHRKLLAALVKHVL